MLYLCVVYSPQHNELHLAWCTNKTMTLTSWVSQAPVLRFLINFIAKNSQSWRPSLKSIHRLQSRSKIYSINQRTREKKRVNDNYIHRIYINLIKRFTQELVSRFSDHQFDNTVLHLIYAVTYTRRCWNAIDPTPPKSDQMTQTSKFLLEMLFLSDLSYMFWSLHMYNCMYDYIYVRGLLTSARWLTTVTNLTVRWLTDK